MNEKIQKINYQLITDEIIKKSCNNDIPSLLLHACCAPCSSYCIEYLSNYFNITLLFNNPNITNKQEYDKRSKELVRLVNKMKTKNPVEVLIDSYEPTKFFDEVKGLEKEPEGGKRCFVCYEIRLRRTAEIAKNRDFDFFTTTLSISPHKNAQKLNEIGEKLSSEYEVSYLFSDFKKRNGFKRSIELSEEYELYRQDYCGCVYSINSYYSRFNKLNHK